MGPFTVLSESEREHGLLARFWDLVLFFASCACEKSNMKVQAILGHVLHRSWSYANATSVSLFTRAKCTKEGEFPEMC
jgi:hypothetical protein